MYENSLTMDKIKYVVATNTLYGAYITKQTKVYSFC